MTTIPQSGLLEIMQYAYFVLVVMSTSIQTQWFHLSRWMWKLNLHLVCPFDAWWPKMDSFLRVRQLKLLDHHTQFRQSKLFGHSFNHHSLNDRNNFITISVVIIWQLKPIEFATAVSHLISDGSFVILIWKSNLGCFLGRFFNNW